MQCQEELQLQKIYQPATRLAQATRRHSMARIALTTTESPSRICGTAFRIGYCGAELDDLALYRLKVSGTGKAPNGRETKTLAGFFILKDGVFSPFS